MSGILWCPRGESSQARYCSGLGPMFFGGRGASRTSRLIDREFLRRLFYASPSEHRTPALRIRASCGARAVAVIAADDLWSRLSCAVAVRGVPQRRRQEDFGETRRAIMRLARLAPAARRNTAHGLDAMAACGTGGRSDRRNGENCNVTARVLLPKPKGRAANESVLPAITWARRMLFRCACNLQQEAYSEEASVPTLDERVAYLEGRVEEHARNVDGVREALGSLEGRMDRRFEGVDARFASLEDKMDRRFEAVDVRFAAIDARFASLEDKMERRFEAVDARFAAVDRRFDSLDTKFAWLIGIVFTAMTVMLSMTGIALFR
jgi:hypothetical protein